MATLTEAWTNALPGVQVRDPLSQGGIVFAPVGSFTLGGVRAIDMATGTTLWQLLPTPEFDEVAGTVLVDGGRLWLGTGNGRFGSFRPFLVDAATGEFAGNGPVLVPSSGLPEALRGDTLALHGGVFQPFPPVQAAGTSSRSPTRTARPAGRGSSTSMWPVTPLAAFLPLTLGPDFVYLPTNGSLATAPGDTAFGTGMHAYPVGGPSAQNCGKPNFENLACPAWATPLAGTTVTPAVLSDDGTLIYTGTDAGTLYALDAATGAVAWTSDIGAPVVAPPATAYGRLFVPAADGRLVVLPAAGCGAPSCCGAGDRRRRFQHRRPARRGRGRGLHRVRRRVAPRLPRRLHRGLPRAVVGRDRQHDHRSHRDRRRPPAGGHRRRPRHRLRARRLTGTSSGVDIAGLEVDDRCPRPLAHRAVDAGQRAAVERPQRLDVAGRRRQQNLLGPGEGGHRDRLLVGVR